MGSRQGIWFASFTPCTGALSSAAQLGTSVGYAIGGASRDPTTQTSRSAAREASLAGRCGGCGGCGGSGRCGSCCVRCGCCGRRAGNCRLRGAAGQAEGGPLLLRLLLVLLRPRRLWLLLSMLRKDTLRKNTFCIFCSFAHLQYGENFQNLKL